MYTSRNYKSYIKLRWGSYYEELGKDVTLEELKERRREKVLYQRRLGFRFRVWLKAFKLWTCEKMIESGYMTEDGVYKW